MHTNVPFILNNNPNIIIYRLVGPHATMLLYYLSTESRKRQTCRQELRYLLLIVRASLHCCCRWLRSKALWDTELAHVPSSHV